MTTIDINCDLGEGMGNDELIMPFISSANIACGFHAGNAETMKETIGLCIKHNVAIGAHPSFYDKNNFGRSEMKLPPNEIYDLVILQLRSIDKIAKSFNVQLHHVKPHGALYNLSAKDQETAAAIARAIKDFNDHLVLFGLSGSFSIMEGRALGLKTASEVFADRTYQDNGSLTPRAQKNALIKNVDRCVSGVLQIITKQKVTTVTRKKIPIDAETVCIHGDGKHAVEFAKAIHDALIKNNIGIKILN
jgi:5-oxoprolinase (ATP-hydrolysing) subunit A